MYVPLDRGNGVPLARQIQVHLERLIAEGLLAPGVKLPATRELAEALGVNRGTVALAYEELVAAGLARAHVGQGTFVAERPGAATGPAPATAV
ncbi:MAG TPA: GntR family transcriptional regulator, partial [Candidatus Tectomicrobia bacterium]|nr:GntR family transcriptional regulator [Candidatus Tectomicrobia bacterium]